MPERKTVETGTMSPLQRLRLQYILDLVEYHNREEADRYLDYWGARYGAPPSPAQVAEARRGEPNGDEEYDEDV